MYSTWESVGMGLDAWSIPARNMRSLAGKKKRKMNETFFSSCHPKSSSKPPPAVCISPLRTPWMPKPLHCQGCSQMGILGLANCDVALVDNVSGLPTAYRSGKQTDKEPQRPMISNRYGVFGYGYGSQRRSKICRGKQSEDFRFRRRVSFILTEPSRLSQPRDGAASPIGLKILTFSKGSSKRAVPAQRSASAGSSSLGTERRREAQWPSADVVGRRPAYLAYQAPVQEEMNTSQQRADPPGAFAAHCQAATAAVCLSCDPCGLPGSIHHRRGAFPLPA
jgi:hypothetical protein